MKQYRIVRIAPLHYGPLTTGLYDANPSLASESYADQQSLLFQASNVYGDGFSKAMRSIGHDANEILYDSPALQKTWAKENGVRYTTDQWQTEIALAQIEDLRPEVVYFQGVSLPYPVRKDLKRRFPFIRLVVVFKGYPGGFGELADVDLLFVSSPSMVDRYAAAGLSPQLLYHAFDDAILEKMDVNGHREQGHEYDFSFVGSSGIGYGRGHQSRYWALVELAKKTNLELWVHERAKKTRRPEGRSKVQLKLPRAKIYLYRLRKKVIGVVGTDVLKAILSSRLLPSRPRRWILEVIGQKREAVERNHLDAKAVEQELPTVPLNQMFPHRCHSAVFGLDMYGILRRSKVAFNCHTDAEDRCVGNIRMFEATGMGSCLLTDTGENMSDLFEEDREVVTYSSIDECIEKIGYLLEHHEVRREIAEAGQRRTLRDHTVTRRCQQIDQVLQEML